MKDWRKYTAQEFCLNVTDGTHDSPKPTEVGHYLITSKHLQNNAIDFSSAYKISEEDYQKVIKRSAVVQHDILFSMIGTIGNTVRVKDPIINYAVKNMAIFKMGYDELKSKWLYYWLKSSKAKEYISSRLAGSTQSYLTLETLRTFPVFAPSENEMQKIVSILSSIDDKIELNRQINDNLEQQAKALYKSWFVDFEPFKDGDFIESEIGEIPAGWSIVKFSDISETPKKTINPQKFLDTTFCHYSLPACDNGLIPEIQTGKDIMSNKIILQNNTTLFSKLNPRIKRIWFTGEVLPNSICSTEFIPFRAKYDTESSYIFSIVNSDAFYATVMGCVNGATGSHQRFHAEDTEDFLCPYNQDVVNEFSKLVEPILSQIHDLRHENVMLTSTRDALLPKLMSGELKINEIDC